MNITNSHLWFQACEPRNIPGDHCCPSHFPPWFSTSPGRSPITNIFHYFVPHLPDLHISSDSSHPPAMKPFVGILSYWNRAANHIWSILSQSEKMMGALYLLLRAISTWNSVLTSWPFLKTPQTKWLWVKDGMEQRKWDGPDKNQLQCPWSVLSI